MIVAKTNTLSVMDSATIQLVYNIKPMITLNNKAWACCLSENRDHLLKEQSGIGSRGWEAHWEMTNIQISIEGILQSQNNTLRERGRKHKPNHYTHRTQ